jgi:hypothetical protein
MIAWQTFFSPNHRPRHPRFGRGSVVPQFERGRSWRAVTAIGTTLNLKLDGSPPKAGMTKLVRAVCVGLFTLSVTSVHAAPRHGLSVFGDLKYPADFKHFDYVNPDAPKGGKVSQIGP